MITGSYYKDSKTLAIYPMPAPGQQSPNPVPGLTLTQQTTGCTFNAIGTYADADIKWEDWQTPWVQAPGSYYGYSDWVNAEPETRQIICNYRLVSAEVCRKSSPNYDPNWLLKGAQGAYNTYAAGFAKSMVQAGPGWMKTVIRFGAEMNGDWNDDSIGAVGFTQENAEAWAATWQQMVGTMKNVEGSSGWLFDWNVNGAWNPLDFNWYYPGDKYVDIIGCDQYDNSGAPLPPVGPTRFSALIHQKQGLNDLSLFAAAHKKPMSVPEWGLGGQAIGDDPWYVQGMAHFFQFHQLAYQAYFDKGDDGVPQLTEAQAPRSLAAYTAAFGHGGANAVEST